MGSSRSTQSTELPQWYQDAAKEAIARANQIYELGRTPYTGVDVVAVNPYEQAASRNVGSMASAFGLDAPAELDMGGMPTVTSGGVTGYSSYPMYVADMQRLKEQRPDQYEYFARMTGFDPITGAGTGPLPATGVGAGTGPLPAAGVGAGTGGNGYTSTQPLAGAGSESDVYVSERDKIAAALGQDPNKPRGMTFRGDYPTMETMPQIRGYTLPDHGVIGNIADDFQTAVKTAGRQIKRDTNKLFGGLSNFLGGK